MEIADHEAKPREDGWYPMWSQSGLSGIVGLEGVERMRCNI
ncbi:MAG: hypothetical protein R8G34_01520 [Paracoccaceae bacterium]|nr:hypothetical protein [Paracoccaceae bacterium]